MESNNIPFVPFNSISLRSEFSLSMLNTNYKLTILTLFKFLLRRQDLVFY